MIRATLLALVATLVGVASASASAEEHSEHTQPQFEHSKLGQSFALLQQRDAQLLSVGWRLAHANAPFCQQTQQSIGLLLQDLAGYGRNREAMRELLDIESDIAVQAIAPGSPADVAGMEPNNEVLTIDGVRLHESQAGGRPAWMRLSQITDSIDALLARNGSVAMAWREDSGELREAVLSGVEACSSRFQVLDKGKKAAADGKRVIFGRDFPGFEYAEPLFAAAVAHELAHNMLGHREWLSKAGRKRKNIRLTEREADRLMPWLLANAGYDPAAAGDFMQAWGPRHSGGLFRKRTHDGWDERAEFIEAEIAAIGRHSNGEGLADWARHFRRDIPL